MSFFLTEEAIHLPPSPDPDMVGVISPTGEARAWALEQRKEKAWVNEDESLSPYKGRECQTSSYSP